MSGAQTILYLFLGVAGIGIVLCVVMLIMSLAQRSIDHDDEDDEYDESDDFDDSGLPEEELLPLSMEIAQELTVDNGILEDLQIEITDIPMDDLSMETAPLQEALVTDAPTAFNILTEDAQPSKQEFRPIEEPSTIEKPKTLQNPAMQEGMKIGKFVVRYGSAQHQGARQEQQDAIECSPTDQEKVAKHGFLSVLCDGMGGMRMGAEAASLASSTFVKTYLESTQPLYRAMKESVETASKKVWTMCQTDDLSGAGTTLVAVLITDAGFSYVSVGDSHVYLLRGGVLSQLNVDHNYLSELLQKVRKGQMTREQALADPERAHLTSYLGMRRMNLIDLSSAPIDLEAGDRILLASDGLFKVLQPTQIAEIVTSFSLASPQALIDEVLLRNYRNQDNISIVYLAIDAQS